MKGIINRRTGMRRNSGVDLGLDFRSFSNWFAALKLIVGFGKASADGEELKSLSR